MKERSFTMGLTPHGHSSCVLMDGEDISGMLRGVVVRSTVGGPTTVDLQPAPGCAARISALVSESCITTYGDLLDALKACAARLAAELDTPSDIWADHIRDAQRICNEAVDRAEGR